MCQCNQPSRPPSVKGLMVVVTAVAALLAGVVEPPANITGKGVLASLFGGLPRLPELRLPELTPPGRPGESPPRGVSRRGRADIPARVLPIYAKAGRDYRVPWQVLAGIGKVETDHGRSTLPGVRSGSNSAGACGFMQIGCVPGSAAGNSWATYGRGSPYRPEDAIPAAARYLVGHGAHRSLDRAIYGYNHDWGYVARVKALARSYGGR